jgi:hypothetical protein
MKKYWAQCLAYHMQQSLLNWWIKTYILNPMKVKLQNERNSQKWDLWGIRYNISKESWAQWCRQTLLINVMYSSNIHHDKTYFSPMMTCVSQSEYINKKIWLRLNLAKDKPHLQKSLLNWYHFNSSKWSMLS